MWLEILEYRDFHDITKAFVVVPEEGLRLFFDCPFDGSLDDYSSEFRVYRLTVSSLPTDWGWLAHEFGILIGSRKASDLEFTQQRGGASPWRTWPNCCLRRDTGSGCAT